MVILVRDSYPRQKDHNPTSHGCGARMNVSILVVAPLSMSLALGCQRRCQAIKCHQEFATMTTFVLKHCVCE